MPTKEPEDNDDTASRLVQELAGQCKIVVFFAIRAPQLQSGVPSAGTHGGSLPYAKCSITSGSIAPNAIVPRWLVTEYQFDETVKEDGTVIRNNPVPTKWSHLRIPDTFNSPDEVAFVLKLGIADEHTHQQRGLRSMVHSDGHTYLTSRFHKVPHTKDQYVVEISLGKDEKMENEHTKAPESNTRISIKIDTADPHSPIDAHLRELKGMVVPVAFGKQTSFIAVVSRSHLPILTDGVTEYPIHIRYINDNVPFQRQMKAVSEIQRCQEHSLKMEEAASATLDKVAAVEKRLDSLTPHPNANQRAAILDRVTSTTIFTA
ncbi:hypothetical protein CC80DRAFT_555801 [Byssothecium circinans]|uniref:Uncharacterized protein n=1 Tax=Byssothecium circinans TaxID=147558 RepID=A0A6A5T8L6_9PLEO|nr:hypothetical protein CC80DRAFT_555801 [Byssothecium circinans]